MLIPELLLRKVFIFDLLSTSSDNQVDRASVFGAVNLGFDSMYGQTYNLIIGILSFPA